MIRLKELRKERKITQGEIAKLCNTSVSNVSGWELGKWDPDPSMLVLLASFFSVSVDYLIGHDLNEPSLGEFTFLSEDEKDILRSYRNLSTEKKKSATAMIKALVEIK